MIAAGAVQSAKASRSAALARGDPPLARSGARFPASLHATSSAHRRASPPDLGRPLAAGMGHPLAGAPRSATCGLEDRRQRHDTTRCPMIAAVRRAEREGLARLPFAPGNLPLAPGAARSCSCFAASQRRPRSLCPARTASGCHSLRGWVTHSRGARRARRRPHARCRAPGACSGPSNATVSKTVGNVVGHTGQHRTPA